MGLFRHFFETPGREVREHLFETLWGFRGSGVWRLLYMGIAIATQTLILLSLMALARPLCRNGGGLVFCPLERQKQQILDTTKTGRASLWRPKKHFFPQLKANFPKGRQKTRPWQQKCVWDFVVRNLRDLAGDFPGRFLWTLFPQQ